MNFFKKKVFVPRFMPGDFIKFTRKAPSDFNETMGAVVKEMVKSGAPESLIEQLKEKVSEKPVITIYTKVDSVLESGEDIIYFFSEAGQPGFLREEQVEELQAQLVN